MRILAGVVKYRTHQAIGVACAVPIAATQAHTPAAAALIVTGSILGSLLPDADHADAHIHALTDFERRHPLLALTGLLLRLPLRLVARLPHRGPITHGFPAVVWVPDLVMYTHATAGPLPYAAVLGIAIGYGAHLLADGATTSGLPGWPFTRRNLHTTPRLLRVTTGTRGELAYALTACTLILLEVLLATQGTRPQ